MPNETKEVFDVCVVGGGISGLSVAAFMALQHNKKVLLLEKNDTIGGVLQNSNDQNTVRDHAANGWLDSEESVQELLRLVGLEKQTIQADATSKKRWLIHQEKLHALSPKILFSRLLPITTIFRVVKEIFRMQSTDPTISLAECMEERFGSDIVPILISPMAAGVYACEAEKLCVREAFPNIWNLVKKGSLIRNMIQQMRKKKTSPKLTTLQGGTAMLCRSIAQRLSKNIRTKQHVTSAQYNSTVQLWALSVSAIQDTTSTVLAKNLVLCCPAREQATILEKELEKDADMHTVVHALSAVQYNPVVVVIHEFKKSDFVEIPVGFGALCTKESQQTGILGILFTSNIFPSHSSGDILITRTIMGGSICPNMLDKTDMELQHISLEMHQKLFHSPLLQSQRQTVIRHRLGIPQYDTQHISLHEHVRELHKNYPHLRLSGNHLFGVAIKDTIRNSKEIATHFANKDNHHST